MIKVKDPSAIADKWAEVTPARQKYYTANASVAGADWVAAASAAQKTYQQAVTDPDIDKRFAGGVKRAGADKYNRKVTANADRFSQGVRDSKVDFQNGVTPFLDEISKITLPARAPRGDPANRKRSEVVGDALHAKRLALKAAGV